MHTKEFKENHNSHPPLLDKFQAAELLNCKPSTLDHWASKGNTKLPFVRIGVLRRYRLSDLIQFIQANRKEG